jgi:hypothetical protein
MIFQAIETRWTDIGEPIAWTDRDDTPNYFPWQWNECYGTDEWWDTRQPGSYTSYSFETGEFSTIGPGQWGDPIFY